jgi:hypothetical protein
MATIDSKNTMVQTKIQLIEQIDSPLSKDKEYQAVKQTIANSYQAYKTNKFKSLVSDQFSNSYLYTVTNYVLFVKRHTTKRDVLHLLQVINQELNLNLHIWADVNALCDQRCIGNTPWRDSFFCEVCSDTPIAKLIERLRLVPTHQQPYFFQTIMFQMIFTLGQKWHQPSICQKKNCNVCLKSCEDVKKYIKDPKDKFSVYASGFRVIYLLEDVIKGLKSKLLPQKVKQTIVLLLSFVNKAELNESLTWKDINSFVELLDMIPLFLFESISNHFLLPQGIQLVQKPGSNEDLLKWMNDLLKK